MLAQLTLLLLTTGPFSVMATTGELTTYGGVLTGGNCGLHSGSAKASTHFAAIGAPIWDKAMKCGMCASAKCTSPGCPPNKQVTVMVTDQCPECAAGDLDFSPKAYADVTGNMSPSRLEIEWSFVTCPSEFVTGNIDIYLKEGSSGYWFALQPLKTKESVQSISIQHSTGTIDLNPPNQNHIDSYYFMNEMAFPGLKGPLTITLTSVLGNTVIKQFDNLWTAGTVISMSGQFNTRQNNLRTPVPTPTPSTNASPSSTPVPTNVGSSSTPVPTNAGPSSTPVPTSTLPPQEPSLRKIGQQCGGKNWKKSTTCVEGTTCVVRHAWYSQCQRSTQTTSTPSSNAGPSSTTVRTSNNSSHGPTLRNKWQQCGGIGWKKSTTCVEETTCVVKHKWYSQCLPAIL